MCEKLPLQNVENNKQNKISIFIAKKIEIRKIKKIGQMCAMIMKGCVSKENNVSLKSGISYILARLMRDFCDFKINFISYFIFKYERCNPSKIQIFFLVYQNQRTFYFCP